jgi:Lar family restriction alleviation protein
MASTKRFDGLGEPTFTFLGKEPRTIEELTHDERTAVLEWLFSLQAKIGPPKPCPFCGLHDVFWVHLGLDWYYKCNDCQMQGPPKKTQEQALDAWNNRKEA